MNDLAINCPACGVALSEDYHKLKANQTICNACKKEITVAVFPVYYSDKKMADAGKNLFNADDASCFYHEGKQAEIACEHCGRFLCTLCDLEVAGKHLCPNCLSSDKVNEGEKSIKERIRYDIALYAFATIPMIMFWPVLITAPLVFIGSFVFWKKPRSVSGHNGFYRWGALILSMIQIALILFIFGAIIINN